MYSNIFFCEYDPIFWMFKGHNKEIFYEYWIIFIPHCKVDSVFRMRSLGTATPGIADQYADGKAARVWQLYIGKQTSSVHYITLVSKAVHYIDKQGWTFMYKGSFKRSITYIDMFKYIGKQLQIIHYKK